MSDYHKYYYDNSDPQEQQKREQLRADDIDELMELDKAQLAELLADERAAHEATVLQKDEEIADFDAKLDLASDEIDDLQRSKEKTDMPQTMADEIAFLKAQNTNLQQMLDGERKEYQSNFGKLKSQVSEQLSQFKETLKAPLRDLIKWRRENVPGAAQSDKQFLMDAIKATKQPTLKQSDDYKHEPDQHRLKM